MGQALTGAKLHKIKIKDTHRSHLSAHASKESDRECPKCRTLRQFSLPSITKWRRTGNRTPTVCCLCSLSLGFSLRRLKTLASKDS